MGPALCRQLLAAQPLPTYHPTVAPKLTSQRGGELAGRAERGEGRGRAGVAARHHSSARPPQHPDFFFLGLSRLHGKSNSGPNSPSYLPIRPKRQPAPSIGAWAVEYSLQRRGVGCAGGQALHDSGMSLPESGEGVCPTGPMCRQARPPRIANRARQSAKANALAWRRGRPARAAYRWPTMPSGKQEPPRHVGGRTRRGGGRQNAEQVASPRSRTHEQQQPSRLKALRFLARSVPIPPAFC